MIRLTRHADYGIILLTHMMKRAEQGVFSARDLALATALPQAMVGKILNELSRSGVLLSQRGAQGGYSLSAPPEDISVATIIAALEGPIALTECLEESPVLCEHVDTCCARNPWNIINNAVKEALSALSLADLTDPAMSVNGEGNLV